MSFHLSGSLLEKSRLETPMMTHIARENRPLASIRLLGRRRRPHRLHFFHSFGVQLRGNKRCVPMATNRESGDGRKITKKDILGEAEEKLAALSLEPNRPIMAANTAAGTFGTPFHVQTNVFGVKLEDSISIWRYDVAVFAEIKGKRAVFFTKKSRDDFVITNRNYKCKLIFDAVLRKHKDFFGDPSIFWYDGQSTLFARKDLFKGVNKTSKKFEIFGKDCHEGALSIFESVYFDLAPVEEHYCMCLTNREIMNYACRLDLSEGDRSLTQFMEIVFNQLAIMNPKEHVIFENGKTFLCHPWLYGFNEKDCPEVGDGKRLFPGTQKSVHFIEGQRGRGFVCPALVIDAKKAAFHEDLKLIDKAKIILNDDLSKRVSEVALERLNFGMKGLFFYTRHTGHERDHQIAGIVNHTAIDTSFEMHDGVKVSVLQYFKEKYKICLEYPHAPLVKVREGGRVNNYPMELGFIRAMQRVTVSQQTPAQTHKTTKNCAIPPGERQDNIKKGAHALKLFGSDGNPFVTSAGLHISKDPMRIIGRCLPPPNIRYSENTAVVHNGKWRSTQEHFFIPARCEIWAMYGIVLPNESGRYSEQLLRDFGRVFFEEASRRGMKLTPPTDIAVTTVERDLENCLKNAALHHCRYCLIVSADSISTHKKMKLWERELEMVTQDVKLSTVIKVVKERRKVTVENIVLKANMKLGGLNYVFDFNGVAPRENVERWLRTGRVFLGIAVVHSSSSGGQDNPTVVGYASNFKENTVDFVGDYLFQSSGREETLSTMSTIITNVMHKFADHHGGRLPTDLLIYRSGISEGSFKTVLTHEIPLLRGTLSALGVKNIKLTFIVVQKKHNVRLMNAHIDRSRKLVDQNIPPGVVVDSNVTHPAFKEFYLNSHITLQGSAITPRYTVLVDDLNFSMDELEGITYMLTYAHQIVNLSTSIPTPLYVAHSYAERGRNNHEAYIVSSASTSSESGESIDYGRIAQRLSYRNTKLEDIRVNA